MIKSDTDSDMKTAVSFDIYIDQDELVNALANYLTVTLEEENNGEHHRRVEDRRLG